MSESRSSRATRLRWPFGRALCLLALLTLSVSAGADLSRDDPLWPLFEYFASVYLQPHEPEYLAAQAWTESNWNPVAVSPVGAVGVMQIMPATGAEIARIRGVPQGPLTNPVISLMYGSIYMRSRISFWSTPRPRPIDTLELAWASYNAGAGNILRAQYFSGGELLWKDIAPHLERVTGHHSRETLGYVQKIHAVANNLLMEADQ